jgi:hypothetical protein
MLNTPTPVTRPSPHAGPGASCVIPLDRRILAQGILNTVPSKPLGQKMLGLPEKPLLSLDGHHAVRQYEER